MTFAAEPEELPVAFELLPPAIPVSIPPERRPRPRPLLSLLLSSLDWPRITRPWVLPTTSLFPDWLKFPPLRRLLRAAFEPCEPELCELFAWFEAPSLGRLRKLRTSSLDAVPPRPDRENPVDKLRWVPREACEFVALLLPLELLLELPWLENCRRLPD